MPIETTTLTVGTVSGGMIPVTVDMLGATFDMEVQNIKDRFKASSGQQNLEYIFGQMLKVLADAGLDPTTATVGQMRTAIEAATYYILI